VIGPEPTSAPSPEAARGLRGIDLARVASRSFYIQALFSAERQQGSGFAFALLPVIRRLYSGAAERGRALARNMGFFGTHPVLAGYVLGLTARLEERRARAVEMRRVLPESVLSEIGRLDPKAISEVRLDAWPDVRSADELHDALQDLIAFPVSSLSTLPFVSRTAIDDWENYAGELVSCRRVASARVGGSMHWVTAERAKQFLKRFSLACVICWNPSSARKLFPLPFRCLSLLAFRRELSRAAAETARK